MKDNLISSFYSLILLTFWLFVSCNGYAQQGGEDSFAVLELFTSQGCSSCPSADRNITNILEERKKGKRPVYVLAFHVDYWDRLGWKDTFGKEEFSDRQRAYGNVFSSNRVYTPQLVVNGEEEFVGSNAVKTNKAIELALATPASSKVGLNHIVNGNNLQLNITVDGTVKDKMICIALVEHGIKVDIQRGENHGRSIVYDGVVRQFMTVNAQQILKLDLVIPETVKKENAEVIVFIQDAENYHIEGANSVVL